MAKDLISDFGEIISEIFRVILIVIMVYVAYQVLRAIVGGTSGLNEVNFPRKMRPRERSEQSWSIFQRWKFIWVEQGATERNRLSPVIFS